MEASAAYPAAQLQLLAKPSSPRSRAQHGKHCAIRITQAAIPGSPLVLLPLCICQLLQICPPCLVHLAGVLVPMVVVIAGYDNSRSAVAPGPPTTPASILCSSRGRSSGHPCAVGYFGTSVLLLCSICCSWLCSQPPPCTCRSATLPMPPPPRAALV